MSHRVKLLFITCLTCFSVLPQALASTELQSVLLTESDRASGSVKDVLKSTSTTIELSIAAAPAQASPTPATSPAPASSTPVSPPAASPTVTPSSLSTPASLPNWLWWGAISLVPIGVIVGALYTLRPRERHPREHKQSRLKSLNPKSKGKGSTIAELDNSDLNNRNNREDQEDRENEQSDESLSDVQEEDPQAPHQTNLPASTNLPVSTPTRLTKVDIVAMLIHDLHQADSNQRRKAIWELGQRGDSRAIQPLVDLLIDSDSNQRGLILAAVTEISLRTLKPLNRALLLSIQDGSPDVRKNAIRDATRIFELVTQTNQLLQYAATSDADADVQTTAEWALGQLNRMRPTLGADGTPYLANKNSFSTNRSPLAEKTHGEVAMPLPEQTEVSNG